VAVWAPAFVIPAVALWMFGRKAPDGPQVPVVRSAATLYATVVIGAWLTVSGSRLFQPSYTLRTASGALSEVIPEGADVTVISAATAFLDTPLRYVEGRQGGADPDYLVVAFQSQDRVRTIIRAFNAPYRVAAEFPLNYGEGYLWSDGFWEGITVFEKAP
jgi:hypothetical protein